MNTPGPNPRTSALPSPYATQYTNAHLIGAHVVAADEDPVRVRVAVQLHELGLEERRLHRVVAARRVRRIPERRRRTGRHVERVAFLHELRVVEHPPLPGRARVDLPVQPWTKMPPPGITRSRSNCAPSDTAPTIATPRTRRIFSYQQPFFTKARRPRRTRNHSCREKILSWPSCLREMQD